MKSLRTGLLAILLLAGCAGPDAAGPLPAAPPAPAAEAVPAAPPGTRLVAAPSPRRGWVSVPVAVPGPLAGGFIDRGTLTRGAGGLRRVAVIANLREAIPIPETGATAISTRYLVEIRCGARRWRVIETRWYAAPNAERQVLRERRDRVDFHDLGPGTLQDLFYGPICRL